MISTLLELLALAGLVKTASFYSAWAAWLVGSLGLFLMGYAFSDGPLDAKAHRLWLRLRYRKPKEAKADSPHPEIKVDPQMQEVNDRLVKARIRRGTKDFTPALSRIDYNGDDVA